MKSSLKFCVVATGEFDLYVAEPRASEWDIAAGHAILENAGGIITDHEGNEITYGKKNFVQDGVIVASNNINSHKKLCLEIKETIKKYDLYPL